MIVYKTEQKICSKSELKRYWVLDLTLSVLKCQVLFQKSFLLFSLTFIFSISVLIVLLMCSIRVDFAWLFNRDLNRGCLVCMFSLRFSGSKFLINLRQQFYVRKIFFRVRKIFRTQFFAGFAVFSLSLKLRFRKCISYILMFYVHWNLLIKRLLKSAFVLVNGIAFNRSNALMI